MKVSQKVFLKNKEGKFLTLRRPLTDDASPLRWDLPGGTVEEGEDLEESLKREVFEEVGTVLTKATLLDVAAETSKNGNYKVTIGYTGEADVASVVLSDEHDEYRFVTKEEFLELDISNRIRRFLGKL